MTGATPAITGPCARACVTSPSTISRRKSLKIALICQAPPPVAQKLLVAIGQTRARLISWLLTHESQIAGREIYQVRKNGRQVRRTDSKPGRKRGRVLIERRRRDPPAVLDGVIRPA